MKGNTRKNDVRTLGPHNNISADRYVRIFSTVSLVGVVMFTSLTLGMLIATFARKALDRIKILAPIPVSVTNILWMVSFAAALACGLLFVAMQITGYKVNARANKLANQLTEEATTEEATTEEATTEEATTEEAGSSLGFVVGDNFSEGSVQSSLDEENVAQLTEAVIAEMEVGVTEAVKAEAVKKIIRAPEYTISADFFEGFTEQSVQAKAYVKAFLSKKDNKDLKLEDRRVSLIVSNLHYSKELDAHAQSDPVEATMPEDFTSPVWVPRQEDIKETKQQDLDQCFSKIINKSGKEVASMCAHSQLNMLRIQCVISEISYFIEKNKTLDAESKGDLKRLACYLSEFVRKYINQIESYQSVDVYKTTDEYNKKLIFWKPKTRILNSQTAEYGSFLFNYYNAVQNTVQGRILQYEIIPKIAPMYAASKIDRFLTLVLLFESKLKAIFDEKVQAYDAIYAPAIEEYIEEMKKHVYAFGKLFEFENFNPELGAHKKEFADALQENATDFINKCSKVMQKLHESVSATINENRDGLDGYEIIGQEQVESEVDPINGRKVKSALDGRWVGTQWGDDDAKIFRLHQESINGDIAAAASAIQKIGQDGIRELSEIWKQLDDKYYEKTKSHISVVDSMEKDNLVMGSSEDDGVVLVSKEEFKLLFAGVDDTQVKFEQDDKSISMHFEGGAFQSYTLYDVVATEYRLGANLGTNKST